jgi:arylformamidase
MEIYDISRTLCRGIAVWPGDPEFRSRWVMRSREGASSNVSAVDLCVHTGTHVDAPLHLDDSGYDIPPAPLDRFVGSARVLAIPAAQSIRASDLSGLDWTNVERVLFKTCCSRLPEQRFDENYVYIEKDAAGFLVEKKMLLVGTDALSVDDFASTDLPCHRMLLQHGIVILEGARLQHVPPGDYELICLPLKLAGLDGSPVRAILRK